MMNLFVSFLTYKANKAKTLFSLSYVFNLE